MVKGMDLWDFYFSCCRTNIMFSLRSNQVEDFDQISQHSCIPLSQPDSHYDPETLVLPRFLSCLGGDMVNREQNMRFRQAIPLVLLSIELYDLDFG